MQSNRFSFKKTVRTLFSPSSEPPPPIFDAKTVSVSSAQIGSSDNLAMSTIQVSLAALKEGSALASKIPYIAPVAGLLLQALTMRDEVKQCKKECEIVMQKLARIADIVISVGESCEKYNLDERDLPAGLRTLLESLKRELDGVGHVLEKCANEDGAKVFILRNELRMKIKQCDGELSNILQAFQARLALDTRFALIAEGREAGAHSNSAEEIPTVPREPNAPQIFFGRDAELDQIVHLIFSDIYSRPARIAILGPGGYGKTTLANAVLTHERIWEHFGDARHFVTCESVSSSEALLIELGKTLGVFDGAPNALWSRIRTSLSAGESILCLDNFESPWDQSDDIKHSVEELLSRITALPHVTILITMRGAERPARTHWSQPFLEPLDTFGHDAAKQVWQAIAGNYDDFSEKLTAAVDHVPLAVDLLSHLSQMTPPMLLWEEWNSKQTQVVQTGQTHRLSSLDYSIQLSIDSERMKANPSAKNLLGVLSMLPDGLHMKQLKVFRSILVDIDIISCLRTLQQCSLIKLSEERYQLHPVIRHFCQNQDIILSEHEAILEDFYNTLASLPFRSSSEAYVKMVLEVNNIKAVLLSQLESDNKYQEKLINASLNFTHFQLRIGDHSNKVISQAVQQLQFVQQNSSAMALLIRSLTMWGRIYYKLGDFEHAEEKLKEAEKLCLSSLDVNGHLYGQVLYYLGIVYRLQDALDDAIASYQMGLEFCKDSDDTQGFIYSQLGFLYAKLGKLDEAYAFQQNALKCYTTQENSQEFTGQGNAYQLLGDIFIRQKKMVEAEAAIQKALELYKASNSLLGLGNTNAVLGRMHLELSQPDKAMAAYQKAMAFHIEINDIWMQGYHHCDIGNVYLFQGMLDEAENSYMSALKLHKLTKSLWGQGNDFYGLGRVYMKRQQLHKAKSMFEEAIGFHKKAQDKVAEQRDQEYLSKLLTQME